MNLVREHVSTAHERKKNVIHAANHFIIRVISRFIHWQYIQTQNLNVNHVTKLFSIEQAQALINMLKNLMKIWDIFVTFVIRPLQQNLISDYTWKLFMMELKIKNSNANFVIKICLPNKLLNTIWRHFMSNLKIWRILNKVIIVSFVAQVSN